MCVGKFKQRALIYLGKLLDRGAKHKRIDNNLYNTTKTLGFNIIIFSY